MTEYGKKLQAVKLDETYEVVVVGGGPAGCAAAIAAARAGRKTLLLEMKGALGGMGTLGLVPAWCPFDDGEKIIYRGIAQKVFDASKLGVPHEPAGKTAWVTINPEYLKGVYDRMVSEAGVTVLFHTTVAAVELAEAGRVDAVIAANKSGLCAYRAPLFVDATGDGDLAAWAGADFQYGDEEGKVQAASLCFQLSGVTEYHYVNGEKLWCGNLNSPVWRIYNSEKYPDIRNFHMCTHQIGPGTVGFNCGHLLGVDPRDPANISANMIAGRRLAARTVEALAEYHPRAFGGAHLCQTAELMGVRETRRIVCDYTLTKEDYLARRSFADEIARNCYFSDQHPQDQAKIEWQAEMFHQKRDVSACERLGKGESHGIPYRSLTPRGLRNVLVSGRMISADREVQGSVRVMPVCLTTGEAAGEAAALAVEDRVDIGEVDTQRLRQRLRANGGWLP